MAELVFIKLGGSLITDKQRERTFRADMVDRLGQDLKHVIQERPDLQILIGHGSGSFGHIVAKRHNTIAGVHTLEQWRGFAEVNVIASELNQLVAQSLTNTGIPVWRIQPSASAITNNGILESMALLSITTALKNDLVPLVYGDVAIDTIRGGTIISTETIFTYLAQQFPVSQLLLLGEVDGVYDPVGNVIPDINPNNFDDIKHGLQGAAGIDVTGGMYSKVSDMLSLAQANAGLVIRIINGTLPSILQQVLIERADVGTRIRGQ